MEQNKGGEKKFTLGHTDRDIQHIERDKSKAQEKRHRRKKKAKDRWFIDDIFNKKAEVGKLE